MKELVNNILTVFEQFRMSPLAIDQYQEVGRSILAEKIARQIERGGKLTFVMLGFPFKSTNNRDKVLGIKPDMAELVTFQQFARFNQMMKEVYEPGVEIKVVSDGYVFNDLLDVNDNTVEDYKIICEQMIKDTNASVKIYDVKDFYSNSKSLDFMRNDIMNNFGISEEQLQNKILFDPDTNMLYKGMIRFMGEELRMRNYNSNNQLHKAAKKLARNMMFRNEAYSDLVRQEFSDDIRLSMHHSVNNGKKYSFQLINSQNAHHSAWHSALVLSPNGNIEGTIHKKNGFERGFELVSMQGQDYHFVNVNR